MDENNPNPAGILHQNVDAYLGNFEEQFTQFNEAIDIDKRHWMTKKKEYLEKEASGQQSEDFMPFLEKLFVPVPPLFKPENCQTEVLESFG